MIGAISGKIVGKRSQSLIVMAQGVGYLLLVPQAILLGAKEGEELFLHVHTHVREDALQLYGFKTFSELELFEMLLSISGIGPKTALAVIDHGVENIRNAVLSSDVTFFRGVPRLGNKNAQKIILELSSKLGKSSDIRSFSQDTQELVEALSEMGFTNKEITQVVKKIPQEAVDLKDKIKIALQLLGSKTL